MSLTVSHKLYWYAVAFPSGKVTYRVVEDPCDTVQFHEGELYFESEAYHILDWTLKNGLAYSDGETSIELPKLGSTK